jgi:hypothetical protein
MFSVEYKQSENIDRFSVRGQRLNNDTHYKSFTIQ